MTKTIGFIGLGVMGKPMVRNLLKASHSVIAYDIHENSVDEVCALGGHRGASAGDIARRSDIVITMLPDGPDVEEVILGKEGVLQSAASGTIVVDMSSISPLVSQKVGMACEARRVEFLDAPVSGGEPKAIDGTLAIMVGGKPEVFEKVAPILRVMGSTVSLTGKVGAGNVTKLANQIMVACNIAALSEALVLASKAGLDPEVVYNAVKSGLAGSAVMNAKAPMICSRNFKPGFRIALHHKDLRNALLAAEALKVSLPLTSIVQQVLVALINGGKGDLDHAAIVQFFEDMSATEVKQGS